MKPLGRIYVIEVNGRVVDNVFHIYHSELLARQLLRLADLASSEIDYIAAHEAGVIGRGRCD